MKQTTIRAKNVTPKSGPFLEMPQRAKLQSFRRYTGAVIPKPLLDYYGIVNPDTIELEISIAEGGYYMKVIHKESLLT